MGQEGEIVVHRYGQDLGVADGLGLQMSPTGCRKPLPGLTRYQVPVGLVTGSNRLAPSVSSGVFVQEEPV